MEHRRADGELEACGFCLPDAPPLQKQMIRKEVDGTPDRPAENSLTRSRATESVCKTNCLIHLRPALVRAPTQYSRSRRRTFLHYVCLVQLQSGDPMNFGRQGVP
jgi:hypothetical protein